MSAAQRDLLRELAPMVTDRGFYLAGGTALAIQLGHRRSIDLDWFSRAAIDPMTLAADLRDAGIPMDVSGLDAGTLHGTARGVKLSFLEYRYPLLAPANEWEAFGVRLAGLADLACMKLSAVGGRGTKKDFVDILALGRESFTLAEMLEFYQEKYDLPDVSHTISALVYFDNAEEENPPQMLWEVDWEEVKRTIEGWVLDYMREREPPRPSDP